MEHSAKKKKKHWGLRILGILLLLAILFLLIQAIRLVPTARRLQTAFSAQNCGITAQLTLDRQELTADQQRFLRSLSLLAGLDETEWDRLKLQGGYEAGAVRLAVYGGEDALLTRLYLTQDCQAVDIRAIYDRAYANLTEKVGLLSHVLPQWNLGEYVALQQLERAFGLQVGTFPDLQSGVERLQSKLSCCAGLYWRQTSGIGMPGNWFITSPLQTRGWKWPRKSRRKQSLWDRRTPGSGRRDWNWTW